MVCTSVAFESCIVLKPVFKWNPDNSGLDEKFDVKLDCVETLFEGSILLLDSHGLEDLKLLRANSCNCESLAGVFLGN